MNGRWPNTGAAWVAGSSTPWTPADLGVDRVWGWFKTDPLTISVNAGKVSEWRSMIGANLLQNLNAASQPTLTAGVSVDCLTSGRIMASPSRGFSTQTSRTIAVVAQYSSGSSAIALDVNAGWSSGFFSNSESGYSILQVYGPGGTRMEVPNAAASLGQKHMSVGQVSTMQLSVKVNGGVEVAQASIMPAIGDVNSGVTLNHYVKEDAGTNYGMTGSYFEIVICYGAALTALEVSQLEGYLAWNNSGMVALLPAGHPFKAAAPTK